MTTKFDMNGLKEEQLRKIDRIVHPRDTLFSIRTVPEFAERWRQAAKGCSMPVQRWMEIHLRQAEAMSLDAPPRALDAPARTRMVAHRFTLEDVELWRRRSNASVTTTDWVEFVLNLASRSVRA